MKKMLVLSVLLGVALICGVAQAQDLTINDGLDTYDLYFAADINVGLSTGPVSLYGVVVRGVYCVGWMTYQPSWGAFKIIVLEDNNCWGFTYEGHWTGDGSPAWASDNVGNQWAADIFVGAASKPAEQAPGKGLKLKK